MHTRWRPPEMNTVLAKLAGDLDMSTIVFIVSFLVLTIARCAIWAVARRLEDSLHPSSTLRQTSVRARRNADAAVGLELTICLIFIALLVIGGLTSVPEGRVHVAVALIVESALLMGTGFLSAFAERRFRETLVLKVDGVDSGAGAHQEDESAINVRPVRA